MSCDRCEDIHKAQREGKTWNECKCSCHYPIGDINFTPYTFGCTCGSDTLGLCPIHGTSFYINTCDSGTDTCDVGTKTHFCGCDCGNCNE